MSKIGNEAVREAEAHSLDHAAELATLRAEYGRLATENGELEARVERLEREKLRLYEACVSVAHQLDYLQALWSKEGITNSLVDQIRADVAEAKP